MATHYVEYRKDKDDYAVYRQYSKYSRVFISNHALEELANAKCKALNEKRLLGMRTDALGFWRKQCTNNEVLIVKY